MHVPEIDALNLVFHSHTTSLYRPHIAVEVFFPWLMLINHYGHTLKNPDVGMLIYWGSQAAV
jgi:hypothetical protein